MDSPALVERDRDIGRLAYSLFAQDDQLGLRAMFWWFGESHGAWKLYVATKFCDKRGPIATYMRLRKLLEKQGLLDVLPLDRIAAVSTNDPVVISVNESPYRGSGAFFKYASAEPARTFQATITALNTTSPQVIVPQHESVPTTQARSEPPKTFNFSAKSG